MKNRVVLLRVIHRSVKTKKFYLNISYLICRLSSLKRKFKIAFVGYIYSIKNEISF